MNFIDDITGDSTESIFVPVAKYPRDKVHDKVHDKSCDKASDEVRDKSCDEACDEARDKSCDEARDEIREHNRRQIDQLSLELMSNTHHYKKYLAKSNPEAAILRSERSARFQKRRGRITTLLLNMLDEYDELTTTSMLATSDIQSSFKSCVDKLLQFSEWTDYKYQYGNNADDDTLFGQSDDTMFGQMDEPDSREDANVKSATSSSYWGKTVVKRSSLDDFFGK